MSESNQAENSRGPQPSDIPVSPTSRNPAWARDELILALDLYVRFQGRFPNHDSAEVRELSETLVRLSGALGLGNDFRNANAVYMKMMSLRRLDPI